MTDPRELPPDDAPVVQVADAIRRAYAEQRGAGEGITEWRYLIVPSRLQWLELAYAAISAWTMVRPPPD